MALRQRLDPCQTPLKLTKLVAKLLLDASEPLVSSEERTLDRLDQEGR